MKDTLTAIGIWAVFIAIIFILVKYTNKKEKPINEYSLEELIEYTKNLPDFNTEKNSHLLYNFYLDGTTSFITLNDSEKAVVSVCIDTIYKIPKDTLNK